MKCDDEATGTLVAPESVGSAGWKSARQSVTCWGASSLPRLTQASESHFAKAPECDPSWARTLCGRVKAGRQGVPVAARQGGA